MLVSVLCFDVVLFFFFKQKTAYEMRISDWSSDVCSSDLYTHSGLATSVLAIDKQITKTLLAGTGVRVPGGMIVSSESIYARDPLRSEEHTSELQSLMRISYAVFCLKKKKKTQRLY